MPYRIRIVEEVIIMEMHRNLKLKVLATAPGKCLEDFDSSDTHQATYFTQ